MDMLVVFVLMNKGNGLSFSQFHFMHKTFCNSLQLIFIQSLAIFNRWTNDKGQSVFCTMVILVLEHFELFGDFCRRIAMQKFLEYDLGILFLVPSVGHGSPGMRYAFSFSYHS